VGLDRGRRGPAADRFSDHRRQQQQYGKQRLIADGDDKHAHGAEHDRLRLHFTEAGDAGRTDVSSSGSVAGRREIKIEFN
jgi:hypothetical protein